MFDHQILVIVPAPCGVSEEEIRDTLIAAFQGYVQSAKTLSPSSAIAQIDPSTVTAQNLKKESHA